LARCFPSLNLKSTVCRCFASSVDRNLFAALTIRAVAVSAWSAVSGEKISTSAPTAPIARTLLLNKTFILLDSLAGPLAQSLRATSLKLEPSSLTLNSPDFAAQFLILENASFFLFFAAFHLIGATTATSNLE
jgi:hypothetical protein